eukprot:scaffold47207_cov62-Cyclotella_meneghiniana.AAC.1
MREDKASAYAYAVHLYMLFSLMFFTESKQKIDKSPTKKNEEVTSNRMTCDKLLLEAAEVMMCHHANVLWNRRVTTRSLYYLETCTTHVS